MFSKKPPDRPDSVHSRSVLWHRTAKFVDPDAPRSQMWVLGEMVQHVFAAWKVERSNIWKGPVNPHPIFPRPFKHGRPVFVV